MPDGYCSDETRTYAVGDPGDDYLRAYAELQSAQSAACAAVRPGVTCEGIDAVARDHLSSAGLGELFIHRTGHGIGLETHEEPYIVEGNALPLEEGMTFSVEPGFYDEGRWGARIEDIVACGADGPVMLNNRPRDLVIVD
jgi:Xaa-Pro aminopeptidase